ncbi:hypothetical protein CEXT_286581 [Caerostris extrusa]|uniref:Uncharacterized protein n=1 Tax=Caerostris extrusa TaxID=172846 RepID=A0AAV4S8Q8_CAEEX|nr:hypothetical protein CEXT_286581 [Caerostris extrusa]
MKCDARILISLYRALIKSHFPSSMCCQTAVLIGFLDHDRLCLGNRVTHKRLSKLGQQSPLRQALPQIMLDDLATSRALGLCCCSSISCFCLGALFTRTIASLLENMH